MDFKPKQTTSNVFGILPKALFIVFFIVSFSVDAQMESRGSIKDGNTGDAIPFVNIGIVGKNLGTVSKNDGSFEILIDGHQSDTIKISSIGYESQTFPVKSFQSLCESGCDIKLKEHTELLDEVKITSTSFKPKSSKEVTLGNHVESSSNRTGFGQNILGNEIGIPIYVKDRMLPAKIIDLNLAIAENSIGKFKFRVNVYNLENGLPVENILNKNIIVTDSTKEGNLQVDLSKYSIIVNGDFFISLEWIEDMDGALMFSTDRATKRSLTIVRNTSQAHWKELGRLVGHMGIGLEVKLLY